jgi:NAD(P)-dependent dehydrogenase (short-subunit alcohol dehydrogenase family)
MSHSPSVLELFDLKNRVAVVTGGAGLLGAEFCRTLSEAGAAVVVADNREAAALEIAVKICASGGQAHPISVDVTSPSSVENLVAETLERHGRLDILVNCAALDPKFDPDHAGRSDGEVVSGSFEDFPLEAWNQALAVNLTGAFLCCQSVARPMLAQGNGVIVNLSSIYGLAAPDQRLYQREGQIPQYKPVYYSVTKFGILGLTRYLATYYAGKNIRVNALSPGGVYNGHDQDFVQNYSARAVLGRMAEKDEMNGALLFLVSDASKYMTGANLVVDGGWTAW